ncbi:hypothetical protein EV363DRAFT_1320667 [Boletus edulis]|nr:hypothetical protein EV363DRAFT_1320667 [Boletus edulis]
MDDNIMWAVRAADMHNFVISLTTRIRHPRWRERDPYLWGTRLQIACALARPSRILILDECTLALDGANQTVVSPVPVRFPRVPTLSMPMSARGWRTRCSEPSLQETIFNIASNPPTTMSVS